LVLATGGEAPVPLGGRSPGGIYGTPTAHVEADTLIWLRFSPRAYLRDWLAGWLDALLNNAGRAYRALKRQESHLSASISEQALALRFLLPRS